MTGQEITLTARHPGRESPRAGRRVSRPVLPRSAAAVPRAGPRARPRGQNAAALGALLGAGVQAGDVPVHDPGLQRAAPLDIGRRGARRRRRPGTPMTRRRSRRARPGFGCMPRWRWRRVTSAHQPVRGSGTVAPGKSRCVITAGRRWCTLWERFRTPHPEVRRLLAMAAEPPRHAAGDTGAAGSRVCR